MHFKAGDVILWNSFQKSIVQDIFMSIDIFIIDS